MDAYLKFAPQAGGPFMVCCGENLKVPMVRGHSGNLASHKPRQVLVRSYLNHELVLSLLDVRKKPPDTAGSSRLLI